MAPRVSGTEVEPSHHLKLVDQDSTEFGFILVNSRGDPDPRAITRTPIPRTARKTGSGETKWSDLEPPYIAIPQDEWAGGRGQLDFEDDRSRYFDSFRARSDLQGRVTLGPLETWATGYRDADQDLPGDFNWISLTSSAEYRARTFSASASYTTGRVYVFVRYFGAVDPLHIEIWSDSAGDPNTMLAQTTLARSDVDNIDETAGDERTASKGVLVGVDLSQALVSGTDYWVVVYDDGVSGTAFWQIGADPNSNGSSKRSTDGSTWLADGSFDYYFRVVDAEVGRVNRFFKYKQAEYMVTVEDDGTAPSLYLNGYRGVATGATQSTTQLQDTTQSWATNELAGAVLLIISTDARGQWADIASNDGDTITVSPAMDIAPTAATTEYVILGLDTWQELTGHGITKPPTDIAVSRDVVYFAQGEGTTIRRLRAQNNAGTWEDLGTTAATRSDDGTNEADFLVVYRHATDGMQVGRIENVDTNGDVGFSRADAQTWGTDLTFGTEIPVGDRSDLATNLGLYGDPAFPVAFKQGSVWFIIDDEPQAIPLSEMQNVASDKNGQAFLHHNVYLWFSLLHGLERYYRNNVDDRGPNRDEGLPSTRQGSISALIGYPGRFFAAVDGGVDNYSSILVHNGGWHEIYRTPNTGMRIRSMDFQVIPGSTLDRLWVDVGTDIIWLAFPSDTVDPYRDPNMKFTHESHIITSWMHANLKDVEKYFHSLTWFYDSDESLDPDDNDIWVDYQVDQAGESSDWRAVGNQNPLLSVNAPLETSTVTEENAFSESSDVTGRRIRLRFKLMSTKENYSPRLIAMLLKAVGLLEVKYAYTFSFRAGDEHINLEGDPDDYERLETFTNQIETWIADARPLTMRAVFSPFDNKPVFVDPPNFRPENIIFDDQIEMLVGQMTVMDS